MLTELEQHFTTKQVIELLFVVGGYIALAVILNTAAAVIEPQILQLAEAAGFPKPKQIPPSNSGIPS